MKQGSSPIRRVYYLLRSMSLSLETKEMSSSVLLKLPVPVSGALRWRSDGGSSSLYPTSGSGLCLRVCDPCSRGLSSGLRLNGERSPHKWRRPFRCSSQLADLAPSTSAVYGALLLGGGLFAYSKSGSKGSLAGGLTGSALMAAAYYLMQSPETKALGDALGFGSAFLFSAVFGIRLAATRKLAPAGPLLGLSLSALVIFVSAYLQDNV